MAPIPPLGTTPIEPKINFWEAWPTVLVPRIEVYPVAHEQHYYFEVCRSDNDDAFMVVEGITNQYLSQL